MASPADQARGILITAAVGTANGSWPIRVGRLTTLPNAQIAIYDTPGQTPNPKFLVDFPTIQVMVRGEIDDYNGAFQKAKEAKDGLLGMDPLMIGSDRWNGVTMMGDIAFLRYDDNSRPLWTGNYRIILEPATNALTHRESL